MNKIDKNVEAVDTCVLNNNNEIKFISAEALLYTGSKKNSQNINVYRVTGYNK